MRIPPSSSELFKRGQDVSRAADAIISVVRRAPTVGMFVSIGSTLIAGLSLAEVFGDSSQSLLSKEEWELIFYPSLFVLVASTATVLLQDVLRQRFMKLHKRANRITSIALEREERGR